jgi:hypothetical protein
MSNWYIAISVYYEVARTALVMLLEANFCRQLMTRWEVKSVCKSWDEGL